VLAGVIDDMTRQKTFARDFALRDQVRCAAVSVMSSIAEGFERGSDAEFGRFPSIAKGSCGEVRETLNLASELIVLLWLSTFSLQLRAESPRP